MVHKIMRPDLDAIEARIAAAQNDDDQLADLIYDGGLQRWLAYTRALEAAAQAADIAASTAHDYIWGEKGVTREQASDAIWGDPQRAPRPAVGARGRRGNMSDITQDNAVERARELLPPAEGGAR